jgi:predicted nuclease of predicted toxin-antitoxin system
MTFFLDGNFPRSALDYFKAAGHTASHALESLPQGTADDKLFACAQGWNAIFVTTDKDFYHTVPMSFPRHYGAIVIMLRKPNRADLLRRLTNALALLGERDLRDTVWLVTDTRIRSRHTGTFAIDLKSFCTPARALGGAKKLMASRARAS